jgi:hypothetical protein
MTDKAQKSPRQFYARRPSKCSKCSSKHVLPIFYGEPDVKMMEKSDNGKIILGGCVITDNDPDWQCLDCGMKFYWKKFTKDGCEMKRFKIYPSAPSELKKIDVENFEPDQDGRVFFPWTDVIDCFDKPIHPDNFKDHKPCPKCSKQCSDLLWIDFRSPDITWGFMCGRAGQLSICPDCKIQVEFILKRMN